MNQSHTLRSNAVPQASNPAAPRPLWIARLAGTQEEMGHQHGMLLREAGGWQEVLDYYPAMPGRLLLGAAAHGPLGALARVVVEAMLARLDAARPAGYRARSRAFMRALGRPAGHARYLMVMDVFQNLVGLAGRLRLGPFARAAHRGATPACSTLMVWDGASADGALRHARNFDFPGVGVWDRAPAVVFCAPEVGLRYGFVTARGADLPGVTAFNEAGLALTAHTRFHREIDLGGAAIVDLGHDIVRRAETISDAIAIARERKVSSTWGLAVSSARERRAVVLEINAAGVSVVEPRQDSLTCANRYRNPLAMPGEVAASVAWAAHSDSRECRLADLVSAARARGGMSAGDLERALDDRIDPDGGARGAGGIVAQACTVASVVIEPESRTVRVSTGPAPTCRGPFQTVPWDWDGAAAAEVACVPPASADSPAERAFAHLADAVRLDMLTHDSRRVSAALEAAVSAAPGDPSYRFLAGVARLHLGEPGPALQHLERGLAGERAPFRTGQLLLWASRAADAAGQGVRAEHLRRRLDALEAPGASELRHQARADRARPLARRRRRGRVQLNLTFVDAL